jgi:hypothetical protein
MISRAALSAMAPTLGGENQLKMQVCIRFALYP